MNANGARPLRPLAAYARLSKKADGTPESITDQNATMDRLARAHGVPIVARFDDNESAWAADAERPGFEAWIKYLRTHDVDAISYHSDRISRNDWDTAEILETGMQRRVRLVTPGGTYDLADHDQAMVFGMLSVVSKNQSAATSRRTRDDKDTARGAGRLRTVYGGKPPLGFRQDYDARGKPIGDDWQIDERAARMLNDAADQFLAGVPLMEVHRVLMLGDDDHDPVYPEFTPRPDPDAKPTKRGTRRMLGVTVKQLRAALQRPATGGVITARDEAGHVTRTGKRAKIRGRGEIIGEAPGGGPLRRAKWEDVQRKFDAARVGSPGDPDRYPYGGADGVLRCGNILPDGSVCGNWLTGDRVVIGRDEHGEPNRFREYYACRNPHPGRGIDHACRGVSVRADEVHRLFRAVIEEYFKSERGRAALAQVPQTAGRRAELLTERAARVAFLADNDTKLSRRLRTAAQHDRIEAEEVAKIGRIDAELDELAKIDATPGYSPLGDWESLTPADKVALISIAVKVPIYVKPGTGGPRPLNAAQRMELIAPDPLPDDA